MNVIWDMRQMVEAIGALPVRGLLPQRTVVVPHERAAHALRRACLEEGRKELLIGTRFVGAVSLAEEVLHAGGITFRRAEEALRPTRVEGWLARCASLEHLDLDHLRTTRGWGEALARTVTDLESAGLRPESLPDGALWRDLAALWRALDDEAGDSWTRPRVLAEATAALQREPTLWPYPGPVLAAVDGYERAVELAFLRAAPNGHVVLLGARPRREHHASRLGALLGRETAEALRSTPAPKREGRELDLLATLLLEGPETTQARERPRSDGPDGSVTLEEHAGIEDELEAAADWVVRCVLDGIALEDIAVLVPTLSPLTELLATRLRRIPWPDGELPLYVEGGLPASSLGGGARLLAVLTALCEHLSLEALAELVPALRLDDSSDTLFISRGDAFALIGALGFVGGNRAAPAGALQWLDRLDAGLARDEAWLAAHPAPSAGDTDTPDADDASEDARVTRAREERSWRVPRLRALRPAIAALVDVAARAQSGAAIGELWPSLRATFETYVRLPGESAALPTLLAGALEPVLADSHLGAASGAAALELVDATLRDLRLEQERFGAPAVTIASVRGAASLRFRAVRIIGLHEGSIPPAPAGDPVLSQEARAQLGPAMLDSRTVALASLHAFDRVVRHTRDRLVLSCPRVDLARSQREPSSLFIEVGLALGRPDARAGVHHPRTVPDTATLRRDAFVPAHEAARSQRLAIPVGHAAWLDRVAAGEHPPASWHTDGALSLARLRELTARRGAGVMDGLLPPGATLPTLPGLTPERPISASKLQVLLECPHRFLLEHVLGWGPPSGPPRTDALEPMVFGNLLHGVAERFFGTHGKDFAAHRRQLADWLPVALSLADQLLDELLRELALAGPAIVEQERRRLHRHVERMLRLEWNRRGEDFVQVELAFGYDAPLRLDGEGGALHVRGRIDKLDRGAGLTHVRDFKTGKAHLRVGDEADPTPLRDLQLGVYSLVIRALGPSLGLPAAIHAAYVYVAASDERRFDVDAELAEPARRWIGVAARLLEAGHFPHTPDRDNCRYCHFNVLCPGEAPLVSAARLARAKGALAAFGALRSR